VLLHRVDGGSVLKGYGASTKTRSDMRFVRELFELGREQGQQWLQQHRSDIGVRQTLRINDNPA
jgi:NTE family protein